MFRKAVGLGLLICFLANMLLPYTASAQAVSNVMPAALAASATGVAGLPYLKGIRLYKDNPFVFDFMISENKGRLSDTAFKQEANKLIKYFLASVTVPENDLWVNLSPYEPDRIAAPEFSQSAMGGDLLAQDYILKQLSASLTHPDTQLGKQYWNAIGVGANNHSPVNNFNKVWIVPQKAVIYEGANSAVIGETRLKVMCDEDYLAIQQNNVGARLPRPGQGNPAPTESFKRIIIPTIEKQVNEGKEFESLRQIYSAVILSTWYKAKLCQSIEKNLLKDIYVDKKKVQGVNLADPNAKEKIYQQYLKAFKDGAYNVVRAERKFDKITRRQYFSGGANLGATAAAMEHRSEANMPEDETKDAAVVTAGAAGTKSLIVSGEGTRMGTHREHDVVNHKIKKILKDIASKRDIDRVRGEILLRDAAKASDGFLLLGPDSYLRLYESEVHGVKKEVLIVVAPGLPNHWGRSRDAIYVDSRAGWKKIAHEMAERDFIIEYALANKVISRSELVTGGHWGVKLDRYLSGLPEDEVVEVTSQAEKHGRLAEAAAAARVVAGDTSSLGRMQKAFINNPFMPGYFARLVDDIPVIGEHTVKAQVYDYFFSDTEASSVLDEMYSALPYTLKELQELAGDSKINQNVDNYFVIKSLQRISCIIALSSSPREASRNLHKIYFDILDLSKAVASHPTNEKYVYHGALVSEMLDEMLISARHGISLWYLHGVWAKYFPQILSAVNEGQLDAVARSGILLNFRNDLHQLPFEQVSNSLIVSGDATQGATGNASEIDIALDSIAQKVGAKKTDSVYDFHSAIPMGGNFLWVDERTYLYYEDDHLVVVSKDCRQSRFDLDRGMGIVYATSEIEAQEQLAQLNFLNTFALENSIYLNRIDENKAGKIDGWKRSHWGEGVQLSLDQHEAGKKARKKYLDDRDEHSGWVHIAEDAEELTEWLTLPSAQAQAMAQQIQPLAVSLLHLPGPFLKTLLSAKFSFCFGQNHSEDRLLEAYTWLEVLAKLSEGSRRSAYAILPRLNRWINDFTATAAIALPPTYDDVKDFAAILATWQKILDNHPNQDESVLRHMLLGFNIDREISPKNFSWSVLRTVFELIEKNDLDQKEISELLDIWKIGFPNGKKLLSHVVRKIDAFKKARAVKASNLDGGVSMKEKEIKAAIETRQSNKWDSIAKAPEFNFNLDLNNFTGLTPVILKIVRAPMGLR